jgi:hypothetical protein
MWIRRRVLRAVERYVPERVAGDVATSVRRLGGDVRGAMAEGRVEMRDREAALRSELRPGSGRAPGRLPPRRARERTSAQGDPSRHH